jgi:hypothetical protein
MEVLFYRQVTFDTARIEPGRAVKARFFEAVPRPHDGSTRLIELDEKYVVLWLLLAPPARHILLDELGLPHHSFCCPEVVEPFYVPGERDLDLILCPPLSPQEGFAIECKRVKVESINAGEDKINKLHETLGGVIQANKLYNGRYAFYQTYFAIITEADASSGQEVVNIPNRGVRSETTPQRGDTKRTTFRQIVEFPGRDDLNQNVGIIFIEVVQPSRLSIDKQATVRICVYRRAVPREQPDDVTNRVRAIML